MRTDFQAAWTQLGALIASKSGHGRGELLAQMARLQADHQVPESVVERTVRLYGDRLTFTQQHLPAAPPAPEDLEQLAEAIKPDEGAHESTPRSRDDGTQHRSPARAA